MSKTISEIHVLSGKGLTAPGTPCRYYTPTTRCRKPRDAESLQTCFPSSLVVHWEFEGILFLYLWGFMTGF